MFSVMSDCPPQVGCSHVTITLAALDITIQGPSWAPAPAPAPAPATSTLCVGTLDLYSFSVADPGFPRGGGAKSPGGAPTYDFAIFSQELHEIERIWARGGRVPRAPLDPPPLFRQ